ncbi:hypothetical protein ACHAXS_007558 [Conticribra weissflogii]
MPGSMCKRNLRVRFDLYDTIHVVRRTREEKHSTWYNNDDKKRFMKNAIRDATFFRQLRSQDPDADLSLYDNRVCSWGLEKNISERTAARAIELKKQVVVAVLASQRKRGFYSSDPINDPYAKWVHKTNTFAASQAQKFGAFREKRIQELFPELEKLRRCYKARNNGIGQCINEFQKVSVAY